MAALTFQHFEILTRPDGSPHIMGKGAMGITYKAFDKNLHSLAVVKVINPQYVADPTIKQRFLQEAQAMASVKHPNIADVFFLGESENGVFFAMEFCDGPTIEAYAKERRQIPVTDALHITQQAASALSAMEGKHLLHRDIKPANILLVKDIHGDPQVKLIDFGLARAIKNKDDSDPNLTKGGFVGTPSFASPEQLLQQEDLDIRSDIYSLGVTLWFMLCGKPPFLGSQFEVMFHHVNTPPPWDKLPQLPDRVQDILKKMLAKSPWQRYQHPNELYKEIQQWTEEDKRSADSNSPNLSIQWNWNSMGGGGSILGRSPYELLGPAGECGLGKLFGGRNVLTQEYVRICYLNQNLVASAGLFDRMRSQVQHARRYLHPHVTRVYELETGDDGVKLVTEWVEGPPLATVLETHGGATLANAVTLLSQLALAFDFGCRHDVGTMRTDPAEIFLALPLSADGAVHSSQFMRQPLGQSGDFSLKVPPFALAKAPSVNQELKTAAQLAQEFARHVRQLLTPAGGQPNLSPAGVQMLDKMRDLRSLPGESPCTALLAELCQKEGVPFQKPVVVGEVLSSTDPRSSRITQFSSQGPMGSAMAGQRSSPGMGMGGPLDQRSAHPLMGGSHHRTTHQSSFGTATATQSAAASKFNDKRLELERKKLKLEADQERLKVEEYLQEQEQIVAQERELLEQQRAGLAAAEQERARAASEERAKLEEESRKLEAQNSDLEAKRQEQERLERELKERAARELQSLSGDRQELEKMWQARQKELEASIKAREDEFYRREIENKVRVEFEQARLAEQQKDLEGRRAAATAQLQAEAQSGQRELEQERARLTARQQELEATLAEQQSSLAQACKEIEDAARELESRRAVFEQEAGQQRDRLAREQAQAQSALKAEQTRLAEAQAVFELEREARQAELDARFNAARAELARHQETLAAEQRSFEEERQKLATRQEEAAQARQAEVEAVRAELKRRQAEFEADKVVREAEIAHALSVKEAEISSKQAHLATLESEKDRGTGEIEAASANLEAARQEIERQREVAEAARLSAQADLQRQLAADRAALAQREAEINRQREVEKAELEAQLTTRRAELAEQQNAVASEQQALQQERETLRARAEAEREGQEARFAHQARELQVEAARLQGEAESQNARLREREATLEAEWQRLEQARAAASPVQAQAEAEREAMQARLRELEERAGQQAAAREEETRRFQEDLEKERAAIAEHQRELEAGHRRQLQAMEQERADFIAAEEKRRAAEEEEHRERTLARAREFAAQEREQQARLDKIKEEIAAREAVLSEKKTEIVSQERLTDALVREADHNQEELLEELEIARKKLDEQNFALTKKLEEIKRARKRNHLLIAAGIIVSGGIAWQVGGRILNPDKLDYEVLWEKENQDRAALSARQDWSAVLDNVVHTEDLMQRRVSEADPSKKAPLEAFYKNKRGELVDSARAAVAGLNERVRKGPEAAAALPRENPAITRNLDVIAKWDLPPERMLVRAKVKIPTMLEAGHPAEALRAYSEAVAASPAFEKDLAADLQRVAENLLSDFRADSTLTESAEVIQILTKLPTRVMDTAPRLTLLALEIQSEKQREAKEYVKALDSLLEAVQRDPAWAKELKPRAENLMASLTKLDGVQLRPLSKELTAAGEAWKLDQAFFLLANAAGEDQQKFDYFRKADDLGNLDARAIVGRFLVQSGVVSPGEKLSDSDKAERTATLKSGLAKIQDGADKKNPRALLLLSELYFAGLGIPEDPAKAAELARAAVDAGSDEAMIALGKAYLSQAEAAKLPAEAKPLYEKASDILRQAVAKELPQADYFLFISLSNPVVNDIARGLKALQAGATRQDPQAIYKLAQIYEQGMTPPGPPQNVSQARDLYAQSARLGDERGKRWCRDYAKFLEKSTAKGDKEWYEANRKAWE